MGLILGIFAHPSQSYCRPHLWDYPFLQDSVISIIIYTGTRNVRGWLQSGYNVACSAWLCYHGCCEPCPKLPRDSCQHFHVCTLPCPSHTFACLAWTSIAQCESSHLERSGGRLRQTWGGKFLEPQITHRAASLANPRGNTVDVSN